MPPRICAPPTTTYGHSSVRSRLGWLTQTVREYHPESIPRTLVPKDQLENPSGLHAKKCESGERQPAFQGPLTDDLLSHWAGVLIAMQTGRKTDLQCLRTAAGRKQISR